MTEKIVYDFEALPEDLPRPPLSALRALLHSGLIVSPKGWQALPSAVRLELAHAGVQGIIDRDAIRKIASKIPPRYMKLVSRTSDPNPDQVPDSVSRALGPNRPLTDSDWRVMRAVDRAVLASLASNSRLLALAYEEILVAMGRPQEGSAEHWFGSVGRCELKASATAIAELASDRFLEGRALFLARVAGIRAARRITDTFDLHTDSSTGYVELDWLVGPKRDSIIWQAHVSTWEGAFFPAASLLAASTAAVAALDMIRETDPAAYVSSASVLDEEWVVGSASSRLEEATSVYTAAALLGIEDAAVELASKATIRMAPEDLPRPPLEELIASSLPPASARDSERNPSDFLPAASASPPGPPSQSARQPAPLSRPAAPSTATTEARSAPALTRVAVYLLGAALAVFVLSVGILAYVLIQL